MPPGVIAVKGERAGIRSQAEGTSSGPTGAAWVDSNGWRIRVARMQNPGKIIWVETEAPKPDEVVRVERYLLGVADSAAHGGRWIVALDSAFCRGVAEGKADSVKDWDRLAAAVRFFEQHTDWEALPGRAVLAVLSDFTGDNEFLSGEILNLAARQQLPYVLIDKTKFQKLPPGLKAVIYADAQAPSAAVRQALAAFVESGGLLITGQAWGKVDGAAQPESPTVRYSVYPSGKGRIAQTKEMDDPYLVAADAQVLLSHRNDVVRLWNGTALGVYPVGDSRRTVVHLLNYAGRPGNDPVTLWVAGSYKSATLHSFEFPQPRKLDLVSRRGGVETHLPPASVYAAVELG